MLNIPQDYEPYKLNCIAGDAVVGILCRRPDGGVSDWHTKMNRVAIDGICPISGKEMKEVRSGVYVRKTDGIIVVMTNSKATKTHGLTTIVPPKRTVMPKRTVTYKKPRSHAPKAKPAQEEISISEMMADALKEAGV